MPAARGVKRAASKSSAAAAPAGSKNKKKRGAIVLEIPTAPKKRGRVFTCGQGDVGQLGLGEDVVETSKFKYVSALGDKIVEVHAGGMHTIALDSNGKVWTFGCNDEGALGRATSGETDEGSPKQVSLPAPAVAIAAGDSHSAALLNNGDVYAWGAFRDSHGSMGLVVLGREGKSCKEPVKVDIGETAVALASGGDHLVILSASGGVFTMGCGEQGQLGRLSQRSATRDARQGFSALLVPSKVTLKTQVCRVWAGYHATFVLDTNDKMFAWGLNNYGQLGITGEKRKTALFLPTECDAFNSSSRKWTGVSCGQHHSLALDELGLVYAVGRCEYGRLGLGEREGDAQTLEVIPTLQNKKVISIAAGTSNSFAVTDAGEVFAWGMGSEGQLGTGSMSDESSPRLAVLPPTPPTHPRHVSAGGQHTTILAEDPSSQKESTPPAEPQPAEQKEEEKKQEDAEEDVTPAKRAKNEQEGEITSTSSAQPSELGEGDKPQKVNGDEKKEIPMEVDETDNPKEKKEAPETETKSADEQTDTEQTEPETNTDSKPETTDSSSQETVHTDKADDIDKQDVEMTESSAEVNGTPESQVVETKCVESIQNANPLTTTA